MKPTYKDDGKKKPFSVEAKVIVQQNNGNDGFSDFLAYGFGSTEEEAKKALIDTIAKTFGSLL